MNNKNIAAIKQALEMILLARKKGKDCMELRAAVRILSELEGSKPRPEIAPECATAPVIRGVHERWHELGYNDQDRAEERFRGQPWKAFYAGWIEGRWPLMVGEGSQPSEPPRYVMSGLAKEAMEVRHEFAAFILDRYGITDHAELRTRIDSLLIMFDQLVEQPKEQGAEPVASAREKAMEVAGDALAKLHTIGNVERWNAAKSTK